MDKDESRLSLLDIFGPRLDIGIASSVIIDVSFKVARLDFLGAIPSKFEH